MLSLELSTLHCSLPDTEVVVLSLDDSPEVVPVLGGDEPAAPDIYHLQ